VAGRSGRRTSCRSPPSRLGSGGQRVLAGAAAGPLAGTDHSLLEELAAPDTPRLTALEGAFEAGGPEGAVQAERLGVLDAGRGLGEPDLRLLALAGRHCPYGWVAGHRRHVGVSCGDLEKMCGVGTGWDTTKAAVPVFGKPRPDKK